MQEELEGDVGPAQSLNWLHRELEEASPAYAELVREQIAAEEKRLDEWSSWPLQNECRQCKHVYNVFKDMADSIKAGQHTCVACQWAPALNDIFDTNLFGKPE